LFEDFDVCNRRGVHPHLSVHRGGEQQRCFGSGYDGRRSVIGHPLAPLLLASSRGRAADPTEWTRRSCWSDILVLRNPATADCGILVLRRINLGEVFRFDKMPVLQAVRRYLFFLMYAVAAGICGGFLCRCGGGTRNRISRTL
jgi:hypothetical protein